MQAAAPTRRMLIRRILSGVGKVEVERDEHSLLALACFEHFCVRFAPKILVQDRLDIMPSALKVDGQFPR
jgi:hypothetical protein